MPDEGNFNMIGGMTADFTAIINNDIGVSITYTPVVTTQRGMDTLRTDGTPATRQGVIFLKERQYSNLDEGFFENADAVLLGESTDTYTRDSKVTYGTIVYRIKNMTESFIYGNVMATKIDMVKL